MFIIISNNVPVLMTENVELAHQTFDACASEMTATGSYKTERVSRWQIDPDCLHDAKLLETRSPPFRSCFPYGCDRPVPPVGD